MTVQINVKHDINVAMRRLSNQQKEVSYAASRALNDTAFAARAELQKTIRAVFDRPTRWAQNAPWVEKAKPKKLSAWVSLDNWRRASSQYTYLIPEIEGGPRKPKRSEILLRQRGILPGDRFIVPAAGARLDAYGNISRGQMQQILAQVRAHFDPHQRTPLNRRTEYFHKIIGGTNGIWRRVGGGILPVLVFVRQPVYRKRLPFVEVTQQTVDRQWPANFSKQLAHAFSSRR